MRAATPFLGCLAWLIASSCATDTCACTPVIVPAVVTGRVLLPSGDPAPRARVRAYSAPAAAACHSLGEDFGLVTAEPDGTFFLGLGSEVVLDSVCVLVFGQPATGSAGLANSDTALLVMDLSDGPTIDSARVELVLQAN